MAKPVLGKSLYSDWFFFGQHFAVRTVSNPCIFVLGQRQQIQNLQAKQRKKTVNIVILHSETNRKTKKIEIFSEISKMDEEDEHYPS